MARSALAVVSSHASDPVTAVDEVVRAIGGMALAGALLFCSHRYDRDELARELTRRLGDFPLIGCTSAGELTQRGYDEDSLVFIGFPADGFAMSVLHFDDLDDFDVAEGRRAVRELAAQAAASARRLGEQLHHAAIFLVDGLSHREELVTMTVQDALGETVMVGGSSGDGMVFRETGVLVDGRFVKDAAVVAMLSSTRPLHAFCSHHYRPREERMVVTSADAQARVVFEINARPAAQEYARIAGLLGGEIDAAFFAANPPMVRAGGEYHIRAVQSANPDGSLTFYCAIDNGIVLRVGERVDRLAHLERLFSEVETRVGEIDHVIGFDCVLNRVDADNRQITREVSQLYAARHVVGFNTYGEQFRAAHNNQTLSGLAIGA
ncbi:FIST N-terminal domain-containing protein [Novosphingobium sp. SG751A]|uniref:FIST N-terminal domain-containing protein n=1 Tax=Novosphingobium sp. SG751A TaxID=2587000 RepID=UPI0035304591